MNESEWLEFEALKVTADGPVRIVTMDRPESLNAADAVMHRELAEVWGRLADDPGCRAVVLTGAGRAFSAGGDLPRMVATQEDQAIQDEVFDEARKTVLGMIELPQPLIAAVNGPAVGLGASLVTLCDLAVASESAVPGRPTPGRGSGACRRRRPAVADDDRPDASQGVRLHRRADSCSHRAGVGPGQQGRPRRRRLLERAWRSRTSSSGHPARALRDTKRVMNLHATRALVGMLDQALACERASVNSAEHAELTRQLIARTR